MEPHRYHADRVDWFCILAWLAVTAAVGISLHLSGASRPVSAFASNLVAALVTVVPATVALSQLVSSPERHPFESAPGIGAYLMRSRDRDCHFEGRNWLQSSLSACAYIFRVLRDRP